MTDRQTVEQEIVSRIESGEDWTQVAQRFAKCFDAAIECAKGLEAQIASQQAQIDALRGERQWPDHSADTSKMVQPDSQPAFKGSIVSRDLYLDTRPQPARPVDPVGYVLTFTDTSGGSHYGVSFYETQEAAMDAVKHVGARMGASYVPLYTRLPSDRERAEAAEFEANGWRLRHDALSKHVEALKDRAEAAENNAESWKREAECHESAAEQWENHCRNANTELVAAMDRAEAAERELAELKQEYMRVPDHCPVTGREFLMMVGSIDDPNVMVPVYSDCDPSDGYTIPFRQQKDGSYICARFCLDRGAWVEEALDLGLKLAKECDWLELEERAEAAEARARELEAKLGQVREWRENVGPIQGLSQVHGDQWEELDAIISGDMSDESHEEESDDTHGSIVSWALGGMSGDLFPQEDAATERAEIAELKADAADARVHKLEAELEEARKYFKQVVYAEMRARYKEIADNDAAEILIEAQKNEIDRLKRRVSELDAILSDATPAEAVKEFMECDDPEVDREMKRLLKEARCERCEKVREAGGWLYNVVAKCAHYLPTGTRENAEKMLRDWEAVVQANASPQRGENGTEVGHG